MKKIKKTLHFLRASSLCFMSLSQDFKEMLQNTQFRIQYSTEQQEQLFTAIKIKHTAKETSLIIFCIHADILRKPIFSVFLLKAQVINSSNSTSVPNLFLKNVFYVLKN